MAKKDSDKKPAADASKAFRQARKDGDESPWRNYNPYSLATRVESLVQDAEWTLGSGGENANAQADNFLTKAAFYLRLLEEWRDALAEGDAPDVPESKLSILQSFPVDKAALKALFEESAALYEAGVAFYKANKVPRNEEDAPSVKPGNDSPDPSP